MAQINKGTVYSTVNSTVTIDNLNQHVDGATLLPGAISEQSSLAGVSTPDQDETLLLVGNQLKRATVLNALGPKTGTGSVVLSTSPVLTTPTLGTPNSGNLSNCTALPASSITGILSVANGGTGSSTATGTGTPVLATFPTITSPTLVSPVLGTPTSGNLSNCSNVPVGSAAGVLPVTNGGTGQSTYANNEILIGNGLGLSKAVVTAGSNITITSAPGSFSIASSVPAATTTQVGGIIPGAGLSMSGNVLNGILPKAIASFSGRYADTTQVSTSWSRAAGVANTITIPAILGEVSLGIGARLYLYFTATTGANLSSQFVEIVSAVGSILTATLSIPAPSPAAAASGSFTYRKCLLHYSEKINSITMLATTSESATYVVNLADSFTNGNFVPIISSSNLPSSTGTSAQFAQVPVIDYSEETGNAVQRTAKSFVFSCLDPGTAWLAAGYRSGVVVFGNF